ncbi:MAG TPA: LytTR family DNA-binding domain-containing protein [Bryobacteraceae bacterium]|jgi:DNA-binding LytR/AlgR family response regulator|nr:LytTR family DNA-binding domain-containing protein [Bryobacteraceae bacterium]
MRALIVDDEPVARKVLREELELLHSVEVVGEADNGEAALKKISSLKPDLVFLDIQMPVMGGFELLDRLNGGYLPAIIMVTAYDQHAIRAFEAGAVDYLLKPIGHERLTQAVERAKRIARDPLQAAESLAQLQEFAPAAPAPAQRFRKLVGKLNEEFFLLSPEEVLAFQAEGDVTWIITSKQRYLATQNLRAIEKRLQNSAFRRIHRNALVNVEQIRKMSMITSQRWLVTLNNGQTLVVSKRQAKNVRDVLNW